MSDSPHIFLPYPNDRYSSCVKCGRIKDHPIHLISKEQNAKDDSRVHGGTKSA